MDHSVGQGRPPGAPVMRSGLALRAPVPVALAADTISIPVMQIGDNATMLLGPEPGLGPRPGRGRGHALAHRYHGGSGAGR